MILDKDKVREIARFHLDERIIFELFVDELEGQYGELTEEELTFAEGIFDKVVEEEFKRV